MSCVTYRSFIPSRLQWCNASLTTYPVVQTGLGSDVVQSYADRLRCESSKRKDYKWQLLFWLIPDIIISWIYTRCHDITFKTVLKYRSLWLWVHPGFYFEICPQTLFWSLINGAFTEPAEAVRAEKTGTASIVIYFTLFSGWRQRISEKDPRSGLPTMSAEEERGVVRVKVKVRNCEDWAAGWNPSNPQSNTAGAGFQYNNTVTLVHVIQPDRQAGHEKLIVLS